MKLGQYAINSNKMTMKIIFKFFLILICLILSNCSQKEKKAKSFNLHGKISGQDTGNIVLQYGYGSAFHQDIAEIKNGNFSFKGMIEEPTRAVINGGNELNRTDIYLEPGVMRVTLVKDKFKAIDLAGSKSQEELNKLNKLLESTNNHDSVLLNFVLKNPKSYLTPYYLQRLGSNQVISLDSLKSIFKGLDLSIQNSRYGRFAKGVIRQKENILEGSFATEFKATDLNNQTVTLSQFRKENVVLLDFWASWCVPCRQSIPHLKALYKKYRSKGLEIIAVTCFDKNKETWLSAINEDSTNMWHHVATVFRNGETINEELALDYPMGPIPRTILIDKDGKVLGSWEGYSKENEDSLDKKLAEILNN